MPPGGQPPASGQAPGGQPPGNQVLPGLFQRVIDIPPLTETRLVADEVVLQIRCDVSVPQLQAVPGQAQQNEEGAEDSAVDEQRARIVVSNCFQHIR